MRVSVLGSVRVDGEVDALSPRDRTVLSALAASHDRSVSVDLLSEALWGQDMPASRVKIVQGCISRLRKRLGPDAIETTPNGYRLELSSDELDVVRFEGLVSRAVELLALGEPDPAEHALAAALALWRGPVLTELDDWDVGRTARQRLVAIRDEAQELRVDALLRAGRPREALGPAVRLVEEQPLREDRWALLARAQYQCDRQAEALETIARARAVLARELGLDVGPALERLQERILARDRTLAVPDVGEVATGRCPWPGLLAFDSDDADQFVGRDDEVEECLRRLRDDGVVVLAGPSGSGKSSLVRAGVAARLRRDGQDVVVLAASRRLETDLPRQGRRPDVIIVDQVEALTAADVGAADRTRTLEALASQVHRVGLVIVVRADRLGEFAVGPIAGFVERQLLLLGPLDGAALRRVIEEPARRAGLLVEPGLVDLAVREVVDEPGALPMLSHVLRSTWERREGRTLTVAGYTAAGGVRGAVARTAEDVHARMDERRRAVLRDLLLRMVAVGDDGAFVAVPLPWGQVREDPAQRAVAERLVDARLVTADERYLSLAHESLTREWPRLRAWLDEDVAGQRLLRHLSVSAAAWDRMGRPDSELYRGVRLAGAQEWSRDRAPALTVVEQSFLAASLAHAEHEQHRARERAERTARTNRRLRRSLRLGVVLGVLTLLAGSVAAVMAARAGDEAVAADARRLGAQALVTGPVDTALLRAVEAIALDDSPDTRASLLELLGRSPALVGAVRPAGVGELGTVSVSADGRMAATYDDTDTLRLVDLEDRTEVATRRFRDATPGTQVRVEGTNTAVTGGAAFHPAAGELLVTIATLDPRPVRLLDPVTLAESPSQPDGFPRGNLLPHDAAWSPDGRQFAAVVDRRDLDDIRTGQDQSIVLVWRADDLSEPTVVDVPPFSHSLAWSPDGATVYVASRPVALDPSLEPTTTVVDVRAGTVARTIPGVGHPMTLAPDGRTIAGVRGTDAQDEISLVDLGDGSEVGRLRTGGQPVRDVAFSGDGERLASGDEDGSVIVWDVATAEVVEALDGHGGGVSGIAATPDGQTLVSVGADRVLLLWDLGGRERFVRLLARPDATPNQGGEGPLIPSARLSPSSTAVAYVAMTRRLTGGVDATVQVLDVRRERLSAPVTRTTRSGWIAVDWLDDDRVVVLSGGRVGILDGDEGTLDLDTRIDPGSTVGAHRDGEWIVTTSDRGRFMVATDTATWERVGPPALLGEDLGDVHLAGSAVRTMPVSSDGRTTATFGGRGRDSTAFGVIAEPADVLVVVDIEDRRLSRLVDLGFDAVMAAFSPDDSTIAVVGRRGRFALVDVATGRLVAPTATGHDGDAVSVAWIDRSGGGDPIVASGGDDGRVTLWDGTTGQSLGRIAVAGPGESAFVGTRPGTDTVVVATSTGDVFAFDSDSEGWIAAACGIAARSLTDEEWRAVAGDREPAGTCAP